MSTDTLGADFQIDLFAPEVVADLESKMATALGQVHSLNQGKAPVELRSGLGPAVGRCRCRSRGRP